MSSESNPTTTPQGPPKQVQAERLELSHGQIQHAEARYIGVSQGGIAMAVSDMVTVERGGIAVAVADSVKIEQGSVGLAIAGEISGDATVLFDLRAAVLCGIIAGVVFRLLRRR